MKKLQILIIGVVLLFGVSVAQAQNDTGQVLGQSGIYRITVRGAGGGIAYTPIRTFLGGSGATVAATFSLQAGDVLRLVTGVSGSDSNNPGSGSGGGGGGSAVILTRNGTQTLLIVAGAGGGAAVGVAGGGAGGNSAQGTPGGGSGGGEEAAGGGGGFNADGGDANMGGGGGKAGTLSGGGAGGNGKNICNGSSGPPCGKGGYGFGGGGGGYYTGGGGGGYGGGAGGEGTNGVGGAGGSSYVEASGFNVTRTDGTSNSSTNQDGSISIATTTAASVSISGRVLTEAKRGLMNASVYLTEADGTVHSARTSTFGYYRFADISAGQTVIITVVSKRCQFAAQVVSVTEDLSELNFYGSTVVKASTYPQPSNQEKKQ